MAFKSKGSVIRYVVNSPNVSSRRTYHNCRRFSHIEKCRKHMQDIMGSFSLAAPLPLLHCCCFPSRLRCAGDILEIAPPIFSSHMLNAVFLFPSQPPTRGHVVLTPIRHFLTKLSSYASIFAFQCVKKFLLSKWDSANEASLEPRGTFTYVKT